ncbi:MAG: long-chain fatty acid--CoA ligase [Ktedonobacteraceae bacterium]
MDGLMMNYQLTLSAIMRRAESLHGAREIVTRLPSREIHRYTYADFIRRAKKLALALQRLGVQPGERVATLCWNHYQHLEAYFAIPISGAVIHTLNLRLSGDDLAYIANHAGDSVVLVDQVLWPIFARFREQVPFRHIIVIGQDGSPIPEGTLDYEKLIAAEDESTFSYREIDENQAAAMCYTSGTTGRPKGVVYSHRCLVLEALAASLPDTCALSQRETLLPVVPMFHINAWGMPFLSTMVGCKLVLPGPYLDAQSLLDLFEREQVTSTAGVPTIWLAILNELDKDPKRWKLVPGMRMIVGGSAAPESILRGFDRHNLQVIHAWGMTETTALGTFGHLMSGMEELPIDEQYSLRALQGRPVPFLELRVRGEQGILPWDGKSLGELEVRAPWVARAYYNSPEGVDRFTEDGWFKTGDVGTVDERGYMKIQDRSKDVIKSAGEWISSVDLENALMGHPAVAEAAVIAIPHPKWQERPLAVVVLKEGQTATAQELLDYLKPRFVKWWLPDDVVFVDSIPRTTTGKFLKMALRQQFSSYVPQIKA